jgi:hypothetical protein
MPALGGTLPASWSTLPARLSNAPFPGLKSSLAQAHTVLLAACSMLRSTAKSHCCMHVAPCLFPPLRLPPPCRPSNFHADVSRKLAKLGVDHSVDYLTEDRLLSGEKLRGSVW